MGAGPNRSHSGFTFGSNGFHCDDLGHGCVLLGTVEFQHFWNALDACFDSPLGRKLIYAATDAEERIIGVEDRFKHGRWFGRRRVREALQRRSELMGWGTFHPEFIAHPAHDALSVGFSLAHREHLDGQRFNVEWRQRSSDAIATTFNEKDGEMTAPNPPRSPMWSGTHRSSSPSASLNLELDVRDSGFYLAEARSMFLPVDLFHHLFASLSGRPVVSNTHPIDVAEGAVVDDVSALEAVVHAACTAFEKTDRPIYVQRSSDWSGHLEAHFSQRGFGRVDVEEHMSDGKVETTFRVQSPVVPFVLGSLIGMWKRAYGTRVQSTLDHDEHGWKLLLREPSVEY